MKSKSKPKSEALAEKIAALKEQRKAAEREEQEAAERELVSLARRADCVEELTVIARRKVDAKRKIKAITNGDDGE